MWENIKNRIKDFFAKFFARKPPEWDKQWTTIYYGARGTGKTLHQARVTRETLEFLDDLYTLNPQLHKAIVFTNQKLNTELEQKYFGRLLFYWEDADEFRYCPRKDCWRGKRKHRLHGCYLIFDDISTILPPDNWQNTPVWLRKTFMQARHFGIRIVANMQDPFAVDVNFRRCVDVAYKFQKLFSNKDPDETKKPIKSVWGIYRRRKIAAEILWRQGDLPEQTIRMLLESRDAENEQLKKMGKSMQIVYDDSWRGSIHFFNRKGKFLFLKGASTEIYDTMQDVKEYKPRGFMHIEYKCIDPSHNHDDPKAANYCGHKKVFHELV